MGKDGIFLGVQPSSNVNVVQLTNDVERVVNELNENILSKKGLTIKWLFDQRPYIVGSVDLVQQNIMIGGALAIFILILFLRSISPTAVVYLLLFESIALLLINLFLYLSHLHT